jgi:hypothetical protein
LSGSGALVVMRTPPGLSGLEASSPTIWATAGTANKPTPKAGATIEVFIFALAETGGWAVTF